MHFRSHENEERNENEISRSNQEANVRQFNALYILYNIIALRQNDLFSFSLLFAFPLVAATFAPSGAFAFPVGPFRGGLKLDASFKLKSSAKESEPICYGVGFGYKNKWLVFKTQDSMKVAERLGMKNPQKTDWETGINAAYELSVFITPPIGDWILAVGGGLSDYSAEGESRTMLEAWSREFGEVQFFSTHRVVEAHCWIKAIEGRIVRAYSWIGESGETEFNEGTPTAVEQGRNLIDTKSPEAEDDG